MSIYIPERGDFIIATFDPQSGHEQKGRRPALVISNRLFNQATGADNCVSDYKYKSRHSVSCQSFGRIIINWFCYGGTSKIHRLQKSLGEIH